MRVLILMGAVMIMLSGCILDSGSNTKVAENGDNNFPTMTGMDLLGEDRVIPAEFDGDYNLVVLAFEREQQKDVNSWIEEADRLKAEHPDLKFYEIPVIYEMSALGRLWVNNGMQSGIPSEEDRARTITVYTDREDFMEIMEMDIESIYPLLLSGEGKILWRGKGPVDPVQLEEMKAFLIENK